jgi:hypothetical protein
VAAARQLRVDAGGGANGEDGRMNVQLDRLHKVLRVMMQTACIMQTAVLYTALTRIHCLPRCCTRKHKGSGDETTASGPVIS